MKLKEKNMERLDLTLDYLIDMTFDSHNYREWKDVPSEHRAAIAILRRLIGQAASSKLQEASYKNKTVASSRQIIII